MNTTHSTKRLGRLEIPDERDSKYLIQPLLSASPIERKWKYHWANGWWGDQKYTPHCVSYSWLHWTADGPLTHHGEESPVLNPTQLYDECQKNDQWIGENYDGTSVRAGAKIMKKYGYIKEYRWAWDIDTIIRAVLEVAPVVVGTFWTESMFYPDKNHMISYTGRNAGGHAYIINGVNVNKGIVRLKNSWGRSWGNNGHAYMSIDDLDTLIRSHGEACLAIPDTKEN